MSGMEKVSVVSFSFGNNQMKYIHLEKKGRRRIWVKHESTLEKWTPTTKLQIFVQNTLHSSSHPLVFIQKKNK